MSYEAVYEDTNIYYINYPLNIDNYPLTTL